MIWDSMSKDKKDEFVKSAHEFTPFFLREKMCVAVAQELESTLSSLLKLTMWFADEYILRDSPKLADMYKSHLQSINAKMSEDMQYQSRHTKKRKFEVFTEDTIRGKPKTKAASKAKANGPGTAHHPE